MVLIQKYLKNIIGVTTGVISFIIYYLTLAPTVNFIDSGELAAVASTLGIAHPTGYPLFTLIGYLFSNFPIEFQVIKKLNLMAAFFSAFGVFVFYNLLVLLNIELNKENDRKQPLNIYIASASSALILGFSRTYWSQSTSIEVYSLHILFIASILYLFFKSSLRLFTKKDGWEINGKYFLLAVFVLGLSFTNHMTTILFLPALGYLLFLIIKTIDFPKKFSIYTILLFFLGVSVYLYLPIRASQNPFFNWGNTSSLEKLLWHISGKQYRVWIFSSIESAEKQFIYYITNFYNEFNLLFIIIGLIGMYFTLSENKKLFIFLLILFITCVGYSINYDIHDIDSYFLISYLVFGIWISIGVLKIIQKYFRGKVVNNAIVIVLPLIPLLLNYRICDESKNYLVEDYMKNVFNSVEENSLIITYQWDYFISASYYFQVVEGYRRDVIIIDKELLRRSWYFDQIKNNYPQIYKNSQHEIKLFLEELYKFEHGIPYNVQIIEQRYSDVIRSFIENNYTERRIYVTPEIENQYLIGYKKIPSGLCYQLVKNEEDIIIKKVDFNYRGIERNDRLIDGMKKMYLRASLENGSFMMRLGNLEAAKNYFEKGLLVEPGSSEIRYLYNQLGK